MITRKYKKDSRKFPSKCSRACASKSRGAGAVTPEQRSGLEGSTGHRECWWKGRWGGDGGGLKY